MPKFNNWMLFWRYSSGDLVPALSETFAHLSDSRGATLHLGGEASGHKYYPDGTPLKTSPIKYVENGVVVTTSGSKYELGDVNPNHRSHIDLLDYLKPQSPNNSMEQVAPPPEPPFA